MGYFGYVYIWYDNKHRKFIIGSHHGTIEDRYTTSTGGIHVRNIFKSRPQTMKFRVLEYNRDTDDVKITQKLEQKWLNMRPDIKNNPRYYNMTNQAGGGFDREIQLNRIKNGTHHFLGGKIQQESNKRRVEEGRHNFTSEHAKKCAIARIANNTHHFLQSNFNKKSFKLKCSDGRSWQFDSKVDAVCSGFTASVIDRLRTVGYFTYIKGTIRKKQIKFEPGDTLYYTAL
jgi:hypothetical protein